MPEQKYDKFLITLRPECGILPTEIRALHAYVRDLDCCVYAAVEDAGSGIQATHSHVLVSFNLPRKKSHLKRAIVREVFSERVKDTYQYGFDIKHIVDSSFLYHLGYVQKEACSLNFVKGFTDEDLRRGYACYLEAAKKALQGKKVGCITLTKKNLFAHIRNWRTRFLVYDPVDCVMAMAKTDRYIFSFASLKQQCVIERYIGTQTPIPRSFISHLIGDCDNTCPNCKDQDCFPSACSFKTCQGCPIATPCEDFTVPVVTADVPFPTVWKTDSAGVPIT